MLQTLFRALWISVIAMLVALAIGLLRGVMTAATPRLLGDSWDLNVIGLIAGAVLGAAMTWLTAIWLLRRARMRSETISVLLQMTRPATLLQLGLGFVTVLGAWHMTAALLGLLLVTPTFPSEFSPALIVFWSGAIGLSLAAFAALEEFIFRGVAWTGLRTALGWVAALVITAILFAAAHVNYWSSQEHLEGALLIGFTLGAIRLLSGSVGLAMGAHAAHNIGLQLYGTAEAFGLEYVNTPWDADSIVYINLDGYIPLAGWVAAVLVAAVIFACRLCVGARGRNGAKVSS